MKQVGFDDLTHSPAIHTCETAFSGATGVSLSIVRPDAPAQRVNFGPRANKFCEMVGNHPEGCSSCMKAQTRLHHNAARKLAPQQIDCFFGLSEVAVPVVAGSRHIATLVSGQFLRREPTERDFSLIASALDITAGSQWQTRAHEAYFDTTVISASKFQSIIQLLALLGQYLANYADRQAIACSENEPPAVASAKAFIQAHMDEPITLDRVVRHVHVSRFYFCKLFKKATGLTLTEYVARVRLEKAKSLLMDPELRVSEIVFVAGFGSIPQFNSVFKQVVGMSPSAYRAQLRK